MRNKLLLLALLAFLAVPIGLLLFNDDSAADRGDVSPPENSISAGTESATNAELRLDPDLPMEPPAAGGEDSPGSARSVSESSPAALGRRTESAGPMVQGRVVDTGGAPVPGVRVEMLRSGGALAGLTGGAEAETDASGRFSLNGKPGEEVTFQLSAARFQDFEAVLDLPESLAAPIEDFVLQPGLVIWGRVLETNGAPIAGAKLYEGDSAFGPRSQRTSSPDAVTDANGAFELPAVDPGSWSFELWAEGYPVRIFRGEDSEAGLRSEELIAQLPRAVSISGFVQGVPANRAGQLRAIALQVNQERQERAWINVPVHSVLVAEDASFRLERLDPAETFDLKLQGASDQAAFLVLSGEDRSRGSRKAIPAGAEGVEIQYIRGADAAFAVVDRETGEPIEDFVAEIGQFMVREGIFEPSGEQRTHHPDGRGVFGDLRPTELGDDGSGAESWTMTVTAAGYVPERQEGITLPFTGSVDLGTIQLQPAPRLIVRVVDDVSGEPVKRAQVVLEVAPDASQAEDEDDMGLLFGTLLAEPSLRERTGSEGTVDLPSFGLRPSILRVTKSRYAPWEMEQLVVGAADLELEVRLALEGQVVVSVVDGDGDPMAGEPVLIRTPSGDVRSQTTGSSGTVKVRKLPAGLYGFSLRSDVGGLAFDFIDYAEELEPDQREDLDWTEVRVAAGSESEIQLRGPRFADLSGTVRLNDQPLIDAMVLIQSNGESVTAAEEPTLEGGKFEVISVAHGTYDLVVTSSVLPVDYVESIEVTGDRSDVNIEFRTSSVSGLVLDASGTGVADVYVSADPEIQEYKPRWWSQGSNPSLGLRQGVAKTDAGGRFELNGLAPRTELILIAGSDLQTASPSAPFQLKDGEARTGFELTVNSTGALHVQFLSPDDGDRSYIRKIELIRTDSAGRVLESLSETGWFENEYRRVGLPGGTWKLQVTSGEPGAFELDEGAAPGYAVELMVETGRWTEHSASLR